MVTYNRCYIEAEKLYMNENYLEALKLFKKACHIKKTKGCLNYIGCCYLELACYNLAERVFKNLAKIYPEWERSVLNLGRVYMKLGSRSKAIRYFMRAKKLNPYEEDTYFYMGVYFEKLEEYLKAIAYYRKSLEINTNQAETHLNLGTCLAKIDDLDGALTEYDSAYKCDNEFIDAIRNKGLIYISMKEYTNALKSFLIYDTYEPMDVDNLFDISYCYYKSGEINKAQDKLRFLINYNSNHKPAQKLYKKILTMNT